MNMTGYGLIGVLLAVIVIALAVGAIWLTCVLLHESEKLKQSIQDVACAYGNIEIEINKCLMHHAALHISDLVSIVRQVGDMVPGVDIRLDREFDKGRHHIVIEAGDVKSKFTFAGLIIEYGTPLTA